MKTGYIATSILGILSLLFVGTISADTRVDKQELEELITGKTLEGQWIMWNTTYKMYMDPSGELNRVYGDGKKQHGRWWVNKKGKLCFEVDNKACRRVKKRGDGGYNLYNKQKELKQTIEKISDGNIYKLKE